MTAPVIRLKPVPLCSMEPIRTDLADIAADIATTGNDLCYSNWRGSVLILRANHDALGQLIEQMTQRGER